MLAAAILSSGGCHNSVVTIISSRSVLLFHVFFKRVAPRPLSIHHIILHGLPNRRTAAPTQWLQFSRSSATIRRHRCLPGESMSLMRRPTTLPTQSAAWRYRSPGAWRSRECPAIKEETYCRGRRLRTGGTRRKREAPGLAVRGRRGCSRRFHAGANPPGPGTQTRSNGLKRLSGPSLRQPRGDALPRRDPVRGVAKDGDGVDVLVVLQSEQLFHLAPPHAASNPAGGEIKGGGLQHGSLACVSGTGRRIGQAAISNKHQGRGRRHLTVDVQQPARKDPAGRLSHQHRTGTLKRCEGAAEVFQGISSWTTDRFVGVASAGAQHHRGLEPALRRDLIAPALLGSTSLSHPPKAGDRWRALP